MGVELDKLSKYARRMAGIRIARVRELYPGPLVYAANFGDEFERDCSSGTRSTASGWTSTTRCRIACLQRRGSFQGCRRCKSRFQKAGDFHGSRFPKHGSRQIAIPGTSRPRKVSLELQARCYEEIFQTRSTRSPGFRGCTGGRSVQTDLEARTDGSHTPWRKPAMEVVRRWYRKDDR